MKIFVYFCGKFFTLKFREKQFWEENLIFLINDITTINDNDMYRIMHAWSAFADIMH